MDFRDTADSDEELEDVYAQCWIGDLMRQTLKNPRETSREGFGKFVATYHQRMDALFCQNGVVTTQVDLETADEFVSGGFDEDGVISNEDGEDFVESHNHLGSFLTVDLVQIWQL